jgi:hypothetical protein
LTKVRSKDRSTERLRWAITAALSSPLVDDIQGFAWEAVFHFAKKLPVRDPLTEGKKKWLFDAVDPRTGSGWSLKAKQCGSKATMRYGMKIDLVIQRADIYSKAVQLGYEGGLTRTSTPQVLGNAIVALWNSKVEQDMKAQSVTLPKLAVLLKSRDRRHYGYFEIELPKLDARTLTWSWVGKGLQGAERADVRLRWHQSGTQLFQILAVPKECQFFSVEPRRIPMDVFVGFIKQLAYPSS